MFFQHNNIRVKFRLSSIFSILPRLCLGSLQWADKTSLYLISEVITNIGLSKQLRSHCLFVGMQRSSEPDCSQYSSLKMSTCVSVTDIKLSSLSREDIVSMLMAEFQLPRRLVAKLADVVYTKTAGHPFFVVQVRAGTLLLINLYLELFTILCI